MNPYFGGPVDKREAEAQLAQDEEQRALDAIGAVRASSLPDWHPAIVLQGNDERSELAGYFTPDEGGEA
jgi:hypothetical protein